MENEKEKAVAPVSAENIYHLNGRVPLGKAIPFGLQHVLAMFVANLAPVLIVCSAAIVRDTGNHLTPAEITSLLQCAMFVAGIGTCLQLYPIWKIGSKLPIGMGVSFTFLGSLLMICTNPELGYEGMVGAVILGGIFEGLVGLSARYWKRFLTPIVSACVVVAIGLSLLPVGMDSWGGGTGSETFGAWYHLLVGAMTLIVCLVSRYLLKGVYKNLNILVGLVFGYVISAVFTATGIAPMIDFSGITKTIEEVGYFSLPKLVFLTGHKPVFDIGAFCTIAIVFLQISYVPQDTSYLTGTLAEFAEKNNLDESLFKTVLRKMDFERVQFEKDMKEFSGGQKKKVLIAKSLCERAHLYVWDEPLNFIDVYSRMQIEQLIEKFSPTMLLIEHDMAFRDAVATKVIEI